MIPSLEPIMEGFLLLNWGFTPYSLALELTPLAILNSEFPDSFDSHVLFDCLQLLRAKLRSQIDPGDKSDFLFFPEFALTAFLLRIIDLLSRSFADKIIFFYRVDRSDKSFHCFLLIFIFPKISLHQIVDDFAPWLLKGGLILKFRIHKKGIFQGLSITGIDWILLKIPIPFH